MNGSPDFLVQRNKILRLLENSLGRAFVQENLNADVRVLALSADRSGFFDTKMALELIDCYQRAQNKLPSWVENFLAIDRRSLEQSSSEQVARYRATVLSGERLLDLTGGLGVDDHFLSFSFSEVISLDMNPSLVEISTYNDVVLNKDNIEHICDDAANWSAYKIDNSTTVYVDPDRRDSSGNRIYSLKECSPPVLEWLDELLPQCEQVVIKASPMLDITQLRREVPGLSSIHVISSANEIKEVMLVARKKVNEECEIIAVELNDGKVSKVSSKDLKTPDDSIETYDEAESKFILEPGAAILKAGLSEPYAAKFALRKAGVSPAFYFSGELPENWIGRAWEILEILPLNWKKIKKHLSQLDMNRFNIVRKYFPWSTAVILKKLRIKEGGEQFLIFLEKADGKSICVRAKRATR